MLLVEIVQPITNTAGLLTHGDMDLKVNDNQGHGHGEASHEIIDITFSDNDNARMDMDDECLSNFQVSSIIPCVMEGSDNYRQAYTVHLPRMKDGFMVNLTGGADNLEKYYTSFGRYTHHGGTKPPMVEQRQVFKNLNDIILEVDGEDVRG
jgi:hypothetical protein